MDQVKKRIKQLRKEMGLTGAELAALIGVSQGNVSDWESEKRTSTPTTKALIAIARELKVSLNWLLLGEGDPYLGEKNRNNDNRFDVSPEEYDLIVKLRALDADNQAEAIEIIERKYARLNKESQPGKRRSSSLKPGANGEEAAASETA